MDALTASAPVAPPSLTTVQWPGVKVVYGWEAPHRLTGTSRREQVEVFFSAHAKVAIALRQRALDIALVPGAACIVGVDPLTWSRFYEWVEFIRIYPDMDLVCSLAEPTHARRVEFETLVSRDDPVLLGVAHSFKRAFVTGQPVSTLHASSLAHLLAGRLLRTYAGATPPDATLPGRPLSDRAIRIVTEYIEAHLGAPITLDQLAALVHLSPFHFARCFKLTLSLAPYQYLTAQRMERAKQLLLHSRLTVTEIAWALGYENLSHFRRTFARHTGLTPAALRQVIVTETRHG